MTFRFRLILAYTVIWGVLLLLAVGVATYAVRQGLYRQVEQTLLRDAHRLGELYDSPNPGGVSAESGGTLITIYKLEGEEAGEPYEIADKSQQLPKEVVLQAGMAPRIYRGPTFRAAYIRTQKVGVFAVSQDTTFIENISRGVARSLLQTLFLLLPIGALLMAVSGGVALAPLQRAAWAVRTRGPNNLTPLPYNGPSDELGQIIERVNSLLEALREAQSRERAFLAEVSHELRTPLTALNGNLDRLSRNPGDSEALLRARRTAEHLSRLVGDLLSLARGEAERTVNPHIVPLGELLSQAVGEYPGVTLFLPPNPPEVLGDPDRLLQLARNLIANAVRAAGRPQGVRVRTWVDEAPPANTAVAGALQAQKWAAFSVTDDGPGIPPEVLPRLFQRFARGPQGGTGLGLAIAKQIAEAHGGRILVSSQPGKTRFAVYLPLLADGEEEAE